MSEKILPGSRNKSAFEFARGLFREGCDRGEILEEMIEWNYAHCSPPLPREEIVAIVAEASKGPVRVWVRKVDENTPKDRELVMFFPQYDAGRGRWLHAKWDDQRYAKRPKPYWSTSGYHFTSRQQDKDQPPTHWYEDLPAPEGT